MRSPKKYFVLISGLLVVLFSAEMRLLAKGLESITPESPQPPADAVAPAAGAIETDKSGTPPPNDVKQEPIQEPKEQPPAKVEPALKEGEVSKETPAAERSGISQKLDGTLFLNANLGFLLPSMQRSSGGSWSARSAGGVGLGYRVIESVPWLRGGPLFVTADYLSVASAANVKTKGIGHSYWAVTQFYSGGAMSQISLKDNLKVIGQVSLVVATTDLDPTDGLPVVKSLKNSELGLSIMGGADWKLADKISFGPRYNLVLGGYQLGYLSACGSFYF